MELFQNLQQPYYNYLLKHYQISVTEIVATGSAKTVEDGGTIEANLVLKYTSTVLTLVNELMSKDVRLVTLLTVTVAAVSPDIKV